MSNNISPTPDTGATASTMRKSRPTPDPGAKSTLPKTSERPTSGSKIKQGPAAQAASGTGELVSARRAAPAPAAAEQAVAGADLQDKGVGKVAGKHMPPPKPPVAGSQPPITPAPLPGIPGGGAAPMPSITGVFGAADQSLSPAQQHELRQTLLGHGLPPNEVDRIIQQVIDGIPVAGPALPGGGVIGGFPPLPGTTPTAPVPHPVPTPRPERETI